MAPRLRLSDVFPGKSRKPIRVEQRMAPTGQFGLVADARDDRDRIEINLPTPPSANNMFVNSAHGGRFKSEKYEGWLSEAGWVLAAQKPGRIGGKFAIDVSVSRPLRKGKVDLDNRLKPLLDLLTKHRVISDDSLAERITLAWSDEGEGVRVVVTRMEQPA